MFEWIYFLIVMAVIFIAYLFHHFTDRQFIKLGKYLGSRMLKNDEEIKKMENAHLKTPRNFSLGALFLLFIIASVVVCLNFSLEDNKWIFRGWPFPVIDVFKPGFFWPHLIFNLMTIIFGLFQIWSVMNALFPGKESANTPLNTD